MPELHWEAWAMIGVIAGAMVLAMLLALASSVRMETHVHETRVKAATLQKRYAEQVAELEAAKNRNAQVEIVGQGSRRAA